MRHPHAKGESETPEHPTFGRMLYVIPITHSQQDMGSLGKRLPADTIRAQAVAEDWSRIQNRVRALALSWREVKVYQDGLPDTSSQIIRKILEEVQSPNYDLLRWLAAEGAEVVGTESPTLLKEEYDRLSAVLTARDEAAMQAARQAYLARSEPLLAERDTFIARRIGDTLSHGQVGILFIGQAHRVAEHLPRDILLPGLPSL